MNFESNNPFNFGIPEKKMISPISKIVLLLLTMPFLIIPLWSINKITFKTNEVYVFNKVSCDHIVCQHDTSCILIICQ